MWGADVVRNGGVCWYDLFLTHAALGALLGAPADTRFHHVPWENILADDVLTWLAWSTFNEPLEVVRTQPKKNRFLDRTFTMLEARTGTKFQPGRSGVPICRLTLDPVNVVSRPFFIYAFANAVNWFLRTKLYPSRGVQLYREGEIE
jgi:hypothetical protein